MAWLRSDSGSGLFHLTVQRGDQLVRIDSRTGARLWTATVPASAERLDTRSGVGYLSGVTSGERAEVHYVSLDPATGRQRFDVVASAYSVTELQNRDTSLDTEVFDAVHAGADGIAFRDRVGRTFYVDGDTGSVAQLDAMVEFGNPVGAFFVGQLPYPRSDERTLRASPKGAARCGLPAEVFVRSAAWLRDQLVGTGQGGAVVAVRLADCAVVPYGPPIAGGDGVLAVPGAVLLIDRRFGTIRGFA